MIAPPHQPEPHGGVSGFRWKLLVAVGLVVSSVTILGIFLVERDASASARNEFQHEFQSALASLHHVQELRYAEIAGRCDALVHNPRIHASLEDDALDLLYDNAHDQLHDLIGGRGGASVPAADALHATFYRFLDARGAIIPPSGSGRVGELTPRELAPLAVSALPDKQENGYFFRKARGERGAVNQVIVAPIASSETGEVISALLVSFEPTGLDAVRDGPSIRNGLWLDDSLYLPALAEKELTELNAQVRRALPARTFLAGDGSEQSFTAQIDGAPFLVFFKLLNPGSVFPLAYEVCVCPLAESLAARRRLRWQIGGLGAVVLLGGLLVSHFLSRGFAAPVERLASDSAENQTQRAKAEAALVTRSGELARAARFSADASHQLKTPVTVLRAGLEELLAQDDLSPENRDGISALVHQTYRLNGVIQDLLLLSRVDAGQLRLEAGVVDLRQLIEGWLDDLSALPDPHGLRIDTDLPAKMCIVGEARYTTLILQNLLENARKYNRDGGRIAITAGEGGPGSVLLVIGNTGQSIAPTDGEHIFERFHRGAMGENVPGHGLGLNLARDLARLHGGDLRLVRSQEDWTEFEVRFRLASCEPPSDDGIHL